MPWWWEAVASGLRGGSIHPLIIQEAKCGSFIAFGSLSLLISCFMGFFDDSESFTVFCSDCLFTLFWTFNSFGFGGFCGLEELEDVAAADEKVEEDVSIDFSKLQSGLFCVGDVIVRSVWHAIFLVFQWEDPSARNHPGAGIVVRF